MSSEKSYQALRNIWEKTSQNIGAEKRIVLKDKDDLTYLYCTGFVDEKQHSLSDWVEAFSDSKKPDGSYHITEAQWLDKVRYHYSGAIGEPFNALDVREGEWSEKDMQRLVQEKILPAVYYTKEQFQAIWEEAKPTFYQNGRYQITMTVKQDLKELIDMYPSPSQVRAMGVLEAKLFAKATSTDAKNRTSAPQRQSSYQQGPSQSQIAAQKLFNILSKK